MKLTNYNSKTFKKNMKSKQYKKKFNKLSKKKKNYKFIINGSGNVKQDTINKDRIIRTSSAEVKNQGKEKTCYAFACATALKTALTKIDIMGHTSSMCIPSTEELKEKIEYIGERAYERMTRRAPTSNIFTIIRDKFIRTENSDIIEKVLREYPIYNKLIGKVYHTFEPDLVWDKVNDMINERTVVGVVYSVGMPRYIWRQWNTKDVITIKHCEEPSEMIDMDDYIGHAMAVVGCDEKNGEKTLIIKNSHGESFGNGGFIEVAFSALNAKPNVMSKYFIIEM